MKNGKIGSFRPQQGLPIMKITAKKATSRQVGKSFRPQQGVTYYELALLGTRQYNNRRVSVPNRGYLL